MVSVSDGEEERGLAVAGEVFKRGDYILHAGFADEASPDMASACHEVGIVEDTAVRVLRDYCIVRVVDEDHYMRKLEGSIFSYLHAGRDP